MDSADRARSVVVGATAADSCSRPGTTRDSAASPSPTCASKPRAISSRSPATTSSRRSRPTAAGSAYRKTGSDGTRTDAGIGRAGPLRRAGRRVVSAPRLVREGGVEPQFDHTGTRLYFREQRAQFVLASVESRRRRRGRARAVAERHRHRAVARRQVGGVSRAVAGVRHAVRADGPPGRPRSARDRRPRRAGLARRRLLPALVGRQPPRALVARARSSSRATCERTFAFLGGGIDKADEPESKGVPIGFTAKADVPTGVTALVGARVITMAGGRRPASSTTAPSSIDGHRIAAVGPAARVSDSRRRAPHRRQAARPSCPASSTRTRTSAPRAMAFPTRDGVAAPGQPRVRRDDAARSVERSRRWSSRTPR